MRRAIVAIATLSVISGAAGAKPTAKFEFLSRESAALWMEDYRAKPNPLRLPAAVRVLSRTGVLKDPESSGFQVGFIAGVLGANPRLADKLVAQMTPLPPQDQWAIVRAIAFSGLPNWKDLLRRHASLFPARQELIQEYLDGKLPILPTLQLDREPTFTEKVKMQFGDKPPPPKLSFARSPELLDTLWGEYFATGDYQPIWRIITLLPWSKDKDNVDRLTVGSMAKVTLVSNASRYPDLLAMLKDMRSFQEPAIAKAMAEIIEAAETQQGPAIRKQALEAIEELKRKGPNYRRDVAIWGQVGQGALALGCIAAAAASMTVLGVPCVVGGAATSAALNYWSQKQ